MHDTGDRLARFVEYGAGNCQMLLRRAETMHFQQSHAALPFRLVNQIEPRIAQRPLSDIVFCVEAGFQQTHADRLRRNPCERLLLVAQRLQPGLPEGRLQRRVGTQLTKAPLNDGDALAEVLGD